MMQDDLFGQTQQQGDMFTAAPAVSAPIHHTPDTVRARMLALLAQARAADAMPWTSRELRSHTVMFPEMAKWLPKAEGEQLLIDFESEISRLNRDS
jgi:hypothetical protein